jgi:hypothetical protein
LLQGLFFFFINFETDIVHLIESGGNIIFITFDIKCDEKCIVRTLPGWLNYVSAGIPVVLLK